MFQTHKSCQIMGEAYQLVQRQHQGGTDPNCGWSIKIIMELNMRNWSETEIPYRRGSTAVSSV